MATWTDTATIKAQVTTGKPGIGTGGFGDEVADNLQYLKDLAEHLGINMQQSIHDDFTASVIDPDVWDIAGGTLPGILNLPDHWVNMFCNGGFSGIAATTKRMRFDLDRDHTIAFEARVQYNNNAATLLLGFQDDALGLSQANNADITDMIGFTRGTNAGTLKFDMAKAGTHITVADNLGAFATPAWGTVKIVITFVGATKKVQAYVGTTQSDYVEVTGSPFTDTAKIPNILMKPWLCIGNGASNANLFVDYADYYWTVRPLST